MENIGLYVLGAVALVLAFSRLLQWLWNMTMPQVFNLKEITYWQSLRLLLIAGILFGGGNINLG